MPSYMTPGLHISKLYFASLPSLSYLDMGLLQECFVLILVKLSWQSQVSTQVIDMLFMITTRGAYGTDSFPTQNTIDGTRPQSLQWLILTTPQHG